MNAKHSFIQTLAD